MQKNRAKGTIKFLKSTREFFIEAAYITMDRLELVGSHIVRRNNKPKFREFARHQHQAWQNGVPILSYVASL